jgi:hypothetical protein
VAKPIYTRPERRVHRGFFYLDDETVINSLSAVEAGKVDEVVAKINSGREGGFSGGLGAQGVKVEGGKKSASSLEEEIVRTRTRFSVFETWYQHPIEQKALGRFEGWGPEALDGVEAGDTVEVRATLEVSPLVSLWRLFLWWAEQAKAQGTMFSVKGEELKQLKEAERNIRMLLGAAGEGETIVLGHPVGDEGPSLAMTLQDRWTIGRLGHLSGQYFLVVQVDQVVAPGGELPALRLTKDAAATPLEVSTLRDAVKEFIQPAKELGVTVTASDAVIEGPALVATPIAIYR